MRKAQMEMMGIAIVVILVSLVFLFVVRFVIFSDRGINVGQEYKESALSKNFLTALLDTSAKECVNIKFSTLFQDCASDKEIMCGIETSCQYLNESKLPDLLDATFHEWRVNYYFVATTQSASDIIAGRSVNPIIGPFPESKSFAQVCAGNIRTATQPLASNPPINLILFICG